jgi:hypothetical protein
MSGAPETLSNCTTGPVCDVEDRGDLLAELGVLGHFSSEHAAMKDP